MTSHQPLKRPQAQPLTPIPPLPNWSFIIALLLTIGIFLITDHKAQKSTEALVKAQDKLIQIKEIQQSLLYYDDVLTTSCLLYAYSQKEFWFTRYSEFESRLDQDMRKLILLQSQHKRESNLELSAHNQALIKLEMQAFTLVRLNQTQEAIALLEGHEYLQAKTAFSTQLKLILSDTFNDLQQGFEDQKKLSNLSRTFVLSMVGLIILIWFWLKSSLLSWKNHSQHIHLELEKTQLKLNNALEIAHIGSATLDLAKEELEVSKAFISILGLTHESSQFKQKITKDQILKLIPKGEQELLKKAFLASENHVFQYILTLDQPEKKFVHLMVYSLEPSIVKQSTLLEVVILDITAQKEKEDNTTSTILSLSDLAQNRLQAVKNIAGDLILSEQREREKISRILHDELQPLILSARMQLSIASKKSKENVIPFSEISMLLENALQISRLVMVDLSPPCLLDRDLKQSLIWLSHWFKNTHHFQLHLSLPSQLELSLSQEEFLFIFTAIKELVFNAYKHSKKTEAYVSLMVVEKQLIIKVWDYGLKQQIEKNNEILLDEKEEIHADHLKIGSSIWAAFTGDLFALQALKASGTDLSSGDDACRTPLHLASAQGHFEVIDYLISLGIDLNPTDRWGFTPLDDAKKAKHLNCIELLQKHGAVSNQVLSNDLEKHYGLKQIEYRCGLFGGEMSFFLPHPEYGFGIKLCLPIQVLALELSRDIEVIEEEKTKISDKNNSLMKRILLVEDNHTLAMDFKSLIQYSAKPWILSAIAVNGKEAISLALSEKADLIVMDISLPEMTGIEASRQILKLLPQQKIMIYSMHRQEDLTDHAFNIGIQAYVEKGVDSQILLNQIEALLKL